MSTADAQRKVEHYADLYIPKDRPTFVPYVPVPRRG
jgi:hypothetical protein